MLIVDGDEISSGKVARSKTLRRFVKAHRPVLALDVGTRHHRRALEDLTGLSVAESDGTHSSDAFYFHRGVAGSGDPQTTIVETPQLKPYDPQGIIGKRQTKRLARSQANQVSDVVSELVRRHTKGAAVARADAGDQAPIAGPPVQGASIPPELQHVGWTYTVTGQSAPPNGFFTHGKQPDYSYQDPGRQTVSWTMNHHFDLYLDNNPDHPDSQHHQVLTYALDGQVTPKQPSENFFHMFDTFKEGLFSNNLERAWWTGSIGAQVDPNAATEGKLLWQASEPETLNAEHEYTSGQHFSLGFGASKDGPEVSAEFGVSTEQTSIIPDWGVENKTSGNHLNWLFTSRHPCDLRPGQFDYSLCFPNSESNFPAVPNDLSRGQMQVHATGRWNTQQVLTGDNAGIGLTVDTPITLADTYCMTVSILGPCATTFTAGPHIDLAKVGPGPRTFSINAAQVVPVGIKSLTIDPSPANGSADEKVTGLVILKDDAPRDTPILLFSDSPNASFVGSGGGGRETTVTVHDGFRRAYFDLQTNDNGLDAGKHTTAKITAFYDGPTTQPLRICAGSPPC
jgi:hypothetical protein